MINLNSTITPPRQRLIHCCLNRPHSRFELQTKIGALNVPDHVMWLRKQGLEIPCEMKPMINRDGKKVKSGEYSFTDKDRIKARKLIACSGKQTIDKSSSISKTTNSDGSITQSKDLGGVE